MPLPPDDLGAAEAQDLRGELDDVLGAWRGKPYADLRDADAVRAERARLDDLRLVALEDRALLRLLLGEHSEVAAELEQLVREHPLRESVRALHVLALVRAGRQSDALAALRDVRASLSDGLGIDPGPGWFTLLHHCVAGEVAFRLGDPDLGARVMERISPYAGRPCSAGAAVAVGPVDGFLALAAWAAGNADAAQRRAAAAYELSTTWRIPAFAAWFDEVWAGRARQAQR